MFSLQTFQNSSSAGKAESECWSCSCSFSCCRHRESLQNQDLTRWWQQRTSSDNAYSPYRKIHSSDPLAELMEQVTCIADDVFALTGLFALLASVLLTKTVRAEAPSEQQEEGLCQGGTAAGTGTGMLSTDTGTAWWSSPKQYSGKYQNPASLYFLSYIF